MNKTHHQRKYDVLRKKFPFFSFEDFSYQVENDEIHLRYHFNMSDKFHFYPQLKIPIKHFFLEDFMDDSGLPAFAFHIGMIELISYWKAACPPKVFIRVGALTEDQIAFWKKLYFFGLGEFFYVNSIKASLSDFMKVEASQMSQWKISRCSYRDEYIVPIGGGKDSVVSIEYLRKDNPFPLVLNPRPASLNTVKASGINPEQIIEINRAMDPLILSLNDQGFLNGHTPFSALLAFLSIFCARITGIRNIALSNESSANEVSIPGTSVNHQYSKSFSFEKDFREYVSSFLDEQVNYFSLLRPLNELQISYLFSNYTDHYAGFRSCNAGSKTDSWCGKCSKCLFTFIILSPFFKPEGLYQIFGKNLYHDTSLIPVMEQLTGIAIEKPLECVGTTNEVNAAMQEYICQGKPDFPLINAYKLHDKSKRRVLFSSVMKDFNPENFVPDKLIHGLKQMLHVE